MAASIAVRALILVSLINFSYGSLELISDSDIQALLYDEHYIVVFFSGDSCDRCDEFESELLGVREDLVDTLNAYVVKVENSKYVRFYGAESLPAIVYFRRGVPMLYDGPANEEAMLEFFLSYREPSVQDLNDDNFEHLTQASSGATTGDWLLLFYDDSNDMIEAFMPRLETVAARNKNLVNVARINRGVNGAKTSRRLSVKTTPSIVYLRHGRMYRYLLPKTDVVSLRKFVEGWYKQSAMEIIPPPKSPFDDLTEACADYVRENPIVIVGLIVIFTSIILWIFCGTKQKKSKKKSSKKKN